jgi:SNF2 family DNA or RNA helicase
MLPFIQQHLDKFRLPPFQHQLLGVQKLLTHPYFGLFDEMGVGKSKQIIDAACLKFIKGDINLVLLVVPAFLQRNWYHPDFGELRKHGWGPFVVYQFHSKGLVKIFETADKPRLAFVVTSYEYALRNKSHHKPLIELLRGRKVWMTCDESSFIQTYSSNQTKGALIIKPWAKHRSILNGMPVNNRQENLFSQMRFLDDRILGLRFITHFRARYCVVRSDKGYPIITGYKNTEELQKRIAPYVLRRKKEDCLDLPPKLFNDMPVTLEPETWRIYQEMRDDAISTLPPDEYSPAAQAFVKIQRLNQITSGLIGGVKNEEEPGPAEIRVISHEKRDHLAQHIKLMLEVNPDYRCLVWMQFRLEQTLFLERLEKLGVKMPSMRIYGAQPIKEREAVEREFQFGTGPMTVLGQPQAGGMGLNGITFHHVFYMSQGYSLLVRKQSEDRCHRSGQLNQVTYNDLIACGPKGQHTINLRIAKALQKKEDVAEWTTGYWRRMLQDEEP